MLITRNADVDEIDVVAVDDLSPIVRPLRRPELLRRGSCAPLVTPDDDGEPRFEGQREESVSSPPGLRMGAAHERVADQRDPERRRPAITAHSGTAVEV